MFSSKNFINGRVMLQEEGIFLRFSFLPPAQSVITLEDLRYPQIESDGQIFCGRMDLSTVETDRLMEQWDSIVSSSYTSSVKCCDDGLGSLPSLPLWDQIRDEIDDEAAAVMKTFSLLRPGCNLQQKPYGESNRTVCGLDTTRTVQLEVFSDLLRFVRKEFNEKTTVGATGSHVRCRAMVILDQSLGVRRMDSIIRLLKQMKSLMFPPTDGRSN
jgi:hypothetical protein